MPKVNVNYQLNMLKNVIDHLEKDALELAKHVTDMKIDQLVHTTKIIVGCVHAVRMYVLTKSDAITETLKKGDKADGKKETGK